MGNRPIYNSVESAALVLTGLTLLKEVETIQIYSRTRETLRHLCEFLNTSREESNYKTIENLIKYFRANDEEFREILDGLCPPSDYAICRRINRSENIEDRAIQLEANELDNEVAQIEVGSLYCKSSHFIRNNIFVYFFCSQTELIEHDLCQNQKLASMGLPPDFLDDCEGALEPNQANCPSKYGKFSIKLIRFLQYSTLLIIIQNLFQLMSIKCRRKNYGRAIKRPSICWLSWAITPPTKGVFWLHAQQIC